MDMFESIALKYRYSTTYFFTEVINRYVFFDTIIILYCLLKQGVRSWNGLSISDLRRY